MKKSCEIIDLGEDLLLSLGNPRKTSTSSSNPRGKTDRYIIKVKCPAHVLQSTPYPVAFRAQDSSRCLMGTSIKISNLPKEQSSLFRGRSGSLDATSGPHFSSLVSGSGRTVSVPR
ncbi:hypothetical protein CDAR_370971 [Caerostris darwini]|uniref:Uncharacterized protein n=1 Tax=Caerostris darwini TaxID=1538125 RepID=A0AAV4NEK2_9ARAC|nr:hypothetical protein CDAR_370971 [Caerostris darwini]